MLWFKRNLFLAVSGLIALILFGLGGYYVFAGYSRNGQAITELEEAQGKLKSLYEKNPFPHATNVAAARAEAERIRGAMAGTRKFFMPIPFTNIVGYEIKKVIDSTLDELKNMAKANGVIVTNTAATGRQAEDPTFSFAAQKTALSYPPQAFPSLPQQLAEVKVICGMLFESKIHRLVNLRRWRIPNYTDGAQGNDYHDYQVQTNAVVGAGLFPYEVSFVCYSQDLATVMENFQKSTYGLILKPLSIEPWEALPQPNAAAPQPPVRAGQPVRPPPAAGVRPPAATPGQTETLVTALNERKLLVTVLVEVIKISP